MRATGWRTAVAVAALPACVVAACGGDPGTRAAGGDASGRWDGSVRDSAGVVVVRNGGSGAWGDSPGWRLEEELRIGALDDPDYAFGLIAGIGVASDGRLFVLDQQAQMLRVYGSDGGYLATVGGPGSGPGEFGPGAGPVLVGPGDTLVVPDIGNARATLVAPDGTPAGSYRLDITSGLPARWADRPNGAIVNQIRPITLPGQEAVDADTMDSIIERDLAGGAVDTLLRVPSGTTFTFSGGTPQFEFFVAEPLWALHGDDGLLAGRNDDYSIRRLDGAGRVDRIIRMPFDRPPVTESDQMILKDALERIWRDAGVPPQGLDVLMNGVGFAEFFPAFWQILAGPDGTIWVQHIVAPSEMPEQDRQGLNPLLGLGAAEWDVFDAEGRFLGVVTMPARFQPLRFEGDRAYGVWRDDLDVQYVMVLRFARG